MERRKSIEQESIVINHILGKYILAILLVLINFRGFGNEIADKLLHELVETNENDVEKRIKILNDLSWEYSYSNLDTAFYYAVQSLNLAEKHKEDYPSAVSNTYGTIGIVYDLRGDQENALKYYIQSLDIKTSLKDQRGIANVKTNIGALFISQEDYGKALPYFNEALEIERELGDTLAQIGSLINISIILKNQNQIPSAKTILHKALELNKIAQDDQYQALIYSNLGAQFVALNELDSAKYYFEISARINERVENYFHLGTAIQNLSSILMRQKQSIAALSYGHRALQIALKNDFFFLLTNSYETIYEIHMIAGNMDSAFIYKSKFETLKDSLLKKENKQIVDEIEAKYELEKNQNTIREKDFQIKQKEKRETLLTAVSVLGAMFTLILATLVISKVRGNRKLAVKNEIIESSLEEKEVLMREIHHRVTNNIQAIKSIINIQKRKSKSEEIKWSLNETLNRVNAMAVIHNRLYKQNNIASFPSNEYLSDLLEDILASFNLNKNESIHLNLCDHNLPPDEMLTLGLIYNELITNSCKYAKNLDGSLSLEVISKIENNLFIISIRDNGNGKKGDNNGFGTELIQAMASKLNGKISYLSEKGLKTTIEFPIND